MHPVTIKQLFSTDFVADSYKNIIIIIYMHGISNAVQWTTCIIITL